MFGRNAAGLRRWKSEGRLDQPDKAAGGCGMARRGQGVPIQGLQERSQCGVRGETKAG